MKTTKRKRLAQQIFQYSIPTALLILVIVFSSVLVITYRQYSQEFRAGLSREAQELKSLADADGIDVLKQFKTSNRLTVVAADGTVRYDNYADADSLENHKEREEIREALETGYGSSVRNSSTLKTRTVNEAVLLKNGMVLRVSDTQSTLLSLLYKTALPAIGVGLLAMVAMLALSFLMAKAIVQPINQIDLEHPDPDHVYEELSPLVTKIKNQNAQIEQQIEDLRKEHESRDQMRREFTANVSHELKTPLTSISGYAELIETGIARTEDVKPFAGKIREESQRLITLVGDIIKLSQLDGDDVAVRTEDIDLYETCELVLNQLEHAAKKRGVTLSLSGEHLGIHGASQVVEELVFNLCDNGIKYNREGGSLSVSLRETEDGKELAVTDTGIGIPEEEIPRIFERFYRVDKSHSREIGGTGLGLSIVKHGVMYLNATISVESKEGEGSTFRVTFPKTQ